MARADARATRACKLCEHQTMARRQVALQRLLAEGLFVTQRPPGQCWGLCKGVRSDQPCPHRTSRDAIDGGDHRTAFDASVVTRCVQAVCVGRHGPGELGAVARPQAPRPEVLWRDDAWLHETEAPKVSPPRGVDAIGVASVDLLDRTGVAHVGGNGRVLQGAVASFPGDAGTFPPHEGALEVHKPGPQRLDGIRAATTRALGLVDAAIVAFDQDGEDREQTVDIESGDTAGQRGEKIVPRRSQVDTEDGGKTGSMPARQPCVGRTFPCLLLGRSGDERAGQDQGRHRGAPHQTLDDLLLLSSALGYDTMAACFSPQG